MSVGLFTEPGRVTERCVSLVAYGATKHAHDLDTFRSSDLAPPEVLASENGTLLVQPLVFGSQPMGIVTCAFGALDTAIYEQMREILGTALQGFRLATDARVKG